MRTSALRLTQRSDNFALEANRASDGGQSLGSMEIVPEPLLKTPGSLRHIPSIAENTIEPANVEYSESGNVLRKPVLLVPKKRKATATFKALQMYDGTVQEVLDGSFIAHLKDKSDLSGEEQVATIELDHVWESDRKLVVPGAVFYWSVGYRIEPHGQRSLVSNIRFRRLPTWTAAELAKAQEYATSLDDLFNTDS